jgi:Hypoxia induced protein conserved region
MYPACARPRLLRSIPGTAGCGWRAPCARCLASFRAVALVMGIASMARGGEYDRAHSAQFMGWRVGLQALTFALLLLALYSAHS